MNEVLRRFAWPLVAFVLAAAATVLGSTAPGLWDPLELDLLDATHASKIDGAPLGPAATGFFDALFDEVHGAGRLPIAFFGLLTAAVTFALARLATDSRGASYAVLLLVGTPVLVLNSRLMLGDSPLVLAQAMVALGAFALVTVDLADRKRTALALAAFLGGALVSAFGAGILLGVMPGLLAAAVVSWIAPLEIDPRVRFGLSAFALACGAWIGVDVVRDAATYRATLGGAPRGDEPPAFHHAIEVAFHGLGPLAALAPLGAAWFFLERRVSKADLLARFAMLWVAFAYGASVLFEARYGITTFAAAPALAVLVALVLRARDERREGSRLAALIVALFVGLLIRDAMLFPESSFDSLSVKGLAIPDDVDLRPFHALGGLVFLAVAVPVLTVRLDGELRSLGAPYRALRAHYRGSVKAKLQLLALAVAFLVMAALGLVGAIAPDALSIRSVVTRALGFAALALLALPAVIALAQLAYRGARRLGHVRHGSLALAAAASGLIFAFGTLPTLSRAFSPRDVFDALSAHRGEGEALFVYETAERSVHHYADEPITRAPSAVQLARSLEQEPRVWALVPKAKLAELNRIYRVKREEHLIVVDDGNPLAYLVTNHPVAGLANKNPLEGVVSKHARPPTHPVGAKLKGGYELVGYEIDGDPGALHPGERFTLRLVWHAAQKSTRAYEVFVHLDGPGGRVHGDHVPVDGLYPANLWEAGDYIIDEVVMRIPAHYAPGEYTFYVGLYQGSHRAAVLEGKKDNDDRIVAGAVEVR
jgi:hypothetical protein